MIKIINFITKKIVKFLQCCVIFFLIDLKSYKETHGDLNKINIFYLVFHIVDFGLYENRIFIFRKLPKIIIQILIFTLIILKALSEGRLIYFISRSINLVKKKKTKELKLKIANLSDLFFINNYPIYLEEEKKYLNNLKTKKYNGNIKFSILVPIYKTDHKILKEMIESVENQLYENWELCLVDDNSKDKIIEKILIDKSNENKKIKVKLRSENGHISRATNDAYNMSTGEYICLMDHDDLISINALYEFYKVISKNNDVDMIYSDEDKIKNDKIRYDPYFKPDWSPESLEGSMYTAHFAAYKKSIVNKILKNNGPFDPDYDGAQDYDFVLRFTEHAKIIKHIPKILYHWRAIEGSTALSMDEKSYTLVSANKCLEKRIERMTGRKGVVKNSQYNGGFITKYNIEGNPLISIIIPTAGYKKKIRHNDKYLIINCIESIYSKTSYKNFEIVVVDNNDLDISIKNFLTEKNIKIISYLIH